MLRSAIISVALWHSLGTFSEPPVAGGRWVVQPRDDGTALVRDDARGLQRTVMLPCGVRTVSAGGVVLGYCTTLLDLTTGARRTFTLPATSEGEQIDVTGAGRHWIAFDDYGYHYDDPYYVNVDTGEQRRFDSPTAIADLDSPALVRRLCAPLRNVFVADSFGTFPQWDQMLYDGHVGVRREATQWWRCGQRRPHALPGGAVAFNDGSLAVANRTRVRVLERRALTLPLPGRGKLAGVAVTRRAVYVTRGGRTYRGSLRSVS